MERAFSFLRTSRLPEKPRKTAMLIASDNGLVHALQAAYLEEYSDLIDIVKFGDNQGLVTRWSEEYFVRKLSLYRKHGIPCFPGGASFEIAYLQHQVTPFFRQVKKLGFTGVEISEDSIPPIPRRERGDFIKEAISLGLDVYTEVGRKLPEKPMDVREAIENIQFDLKTGSKKVTVEGAEVNAIRRGEGDPNSLLAIVKEVGMENLIFECGPGPYPETPVFLIRTLGPEVNLMNIALTECNFVRTMRLGMHRVVGWDFISEKRWETR